MQRPCSCCMLQLNSRTGIWGLLTRCGTLAVSTRSALIAYGRRISLKCFSRIPTRSPNGWQSRGMYVIPIGVMNEKGPKSYVLSAMMDSLILVFHTATEGRDGNIFFCLDQVIKQIRQLQTRHCFFYYFKQLMYVFHSSMSSYTKGHHSWSCDV